MKTALPLSPTGDEMSLTERFFRMRAIAPFDRLYDGELAIIAQAAIPRRYAPGHRLLSAYKPPNALFIVLEGSLTTPSGDPLPRIFSPEYLVMGLPLEQDVIADAKTGALCLLISKGHFFTLLYECPALTMGFSDLITPSS